MSAAAVIVNREEGGELASALLSAAVHVVLLAVLIFGVRWQNRPPEAVEVELWVPPPAPAIEAPKPVPAPKVEPAPPPKPEPVIPKPEIVEKAPPPKPAPKAPPKVEPKPPPPKPVAKVEPKPVAKPEPLKPKVDYTQRMQEEAMREQAVRESQRLKDQAAREAASVETSALAGWKEKVALHIRSRIRIEVAQAVTGNPEAIFLVTILPSYEVLKISKVKPSGNAAYDDEVERAILRASPLPRPDKPDLFTRELRLTFHPKDR